MHVYPLLFEPIFVPKIWGGRRFETQLGKKLPPDALFGESWELADLPNGQSVVRSGPCKGKTLGQLVREWGADLLGHASLADGRFPLLIKFLDANQDLSVQVHPTPAIAASEPDAFLKNEAWYVVAAEPGSAIYHGLVPGVTREQFVEALNRGEVAPLLRRVLVRAGDCYYLPSGTVHALGAGVLVAEVQTPSDTTYRLFDWNRIDEATSKPRPLHVEQALRCIDFDAPAMSLRQDRSHVSDFATTVTRLAACEQFVMEKVRMAEGVEKDIPSGEPAVWMLLEGEVEIACGTGADRVTARRGDVVLLPAALQRGRLRVTQAAVWIEATVGTLKGG